jgi:hypothetical protein
MRRTPVNNISELIKKVSRIRLKSSGQRGKGAGESGVISPLGKCFSVVALGSLFAAILLSK